MDKSAKRSIAIDALRGVAILLVIIRHVLPNAGEWQGPVLFKYLIAVIRRGGWVGVDIFFVLSGFLVSGLLFAEYRRYQKISILRFYARRGFKIYPAFYWMIGVSLALLYCSEAFPSPMNIVSECLFLQSYLPGIWWHTWSLAVEEHFYLILPLFLTILHRESFRYLLPAIAIIMVLCLAIRIWTAFNYEYQHLTSVFPTHLRVDSLFLGAALAYCYQCKSAWWNQLARFKYLFLFLGLLFLLPAFVVRLESHALMYTAGFTVFALGSAMILISMLSFDLNGSKVLQALSRIGYYSYSIYLWHLVIILWLIPQLQLQYGFVLLFPWRVIVCLILSILVGVAMSMILEYPMLKVRDYWFPSRSGSIIQPSAKPPS